jgi:hypothetical protein
MATKQTLYNSVSSAKKERCQLLYARCSICKADFSISHSGSDAQKYSTDVDTCVYVYTEVFRENTEISLKIRDFFCQKY